MRAGGGRTLAGFSFQADKTRLQLFAGANSQSPHPNLLPEGEGGIQNPAPFLAGCPKRSLGTQTAEATTVAIAPTHVTSDHLSNYRLCMFLVPSPINTGASSY